MNLNIHRYLDEAFAGIELTAEVQDLKEEVRGNVAARAEELEAGGMTADAAARAAIDELGPIRALIDSLEPSSTSVMELIARNRVRPSALFVVRTVVTALVLAAAATVVALAAVGYFPTALSVAAGVVAAIAVGLIVTDALRQETSQDYALPTRRAVLFGLSGFAAAFGLSQLAQFMHAPIWWLVVGGVIAAASLVGFISLGVTQTNRKKAWALEMQRMYKDRFTEDPASAARFGIYTVVIWLSTAIVFLVLTAMGFSWSWIVFLGGVAVFMLTLAKMLFPAEKK